MISSASHPFPEKWLREKLALYDPSIPAGETVWGKTLLAYGEEVLSYCVRMLDSALLLCQEDPVLGDKFAPVLSEEREQARRLGALAADGQWKRLGGGLAKRCVSQRCGRPKAMRTTL